MPAPTALVTGVAGQDGVYLARALVAEGVRVVGTVAPGGATAARQAVYLRDVDVRVLDVRDREAVRSLVDEVVPDEIYNLAAVSSVGRSWEEPELTRAVNADAVDHLVAAALAVRDRTRTDVRLVQASSAEVHGLLGNTINK